MRTAGEPARPAPGQQRARQGPRRAGADPLRRSSPTRPRSSSTPSRRRSRRSRARRPSTSSSTTEVVEGAPVVIPDVAVVLLGSGFGARDSVETLAAAPRSRWRGLALDRRTRTVAAAAGLAEASVFAGHRPGAGHARAARALGRSSGFPNVAPGPRAQLPGPAPRDRRARDRARPPGRTRSSGSSRSSRAPTCRS